MSDIKLDSLYIKNFKGCSERTVNFGDVTEISGANGTGKTTVFDAFLWLLFGTNSVGMSDKSTNFSRPKDIAGHRIDNVDIEVAASLSVDGKPVQLQKVQKQKWSRVRGTDQLVLKGNENSYAINSVDKKEKDFVEYINSIIDVEKFKLLTDIDYFLNLPNEDVKGKPGKMSLLLELCGDVTDEDIINSDPDKWSFIADDVLSMGVRDAITKAKREKAAAEKAEKEIPARIDEVSRQMKTVPDVVVLTERLNNVTRKIADCNAELQTYGSEDRIAETRAELTSLKSKKADMYFQAKNELAHEQEEVFSGYNEVRKVLSSKEFSLQKAHGMAIKLESQIEVMNAELTNLGRTYKETLNPVPFDEASAMCRYCGQMLPQGRVEELRARHEATEHERVQKNSEVLAKGKEIKAELVALQSQLDAVKAEGKEIESEIQNLRAQCEKLKAGTDTLPKEPDMSGNAEYQDILKQIESAEKELESLCSKQEEARRVKAELAELNNELSSVTRQIAEVEQIQAFNIGVKARIEELNEEHRNIGQNIANAERKVILLEEFTIARSKMLSERINSHFEIARFSLIDEYQSGGTGTAVHVTYGGINDKNINNGHLMLTCIDIIRTFQKHFDTHLPLFVDNAEALSSDNTPKLDSQLILLKVTDDPELKVSVA